MHSTGIDIRDALCRAREGTLGRHEPPPCRHEPSRFVRQTEPPLCSKSLRNAVNEPQIVMIFKLYWLTKWLTRFMLTIKHVLHSKEAIWKFISEFYFVLIDLSKNIWTIHIRHLSDVLVSRNWYKIVSKLYQIVNISDFV